MAFLVPQQKQWNAKKNQRDCIAAIGDTGRHSQTSPSFAKQGLRFFGVNLRVDLMCVGEPVRPGHWPLHQ
tara:strand:+ start:691 stop:900 length:210 start_codon:yes stop_codon:yes gene_type:complete